MKLNDKTLERLREIINADDRPADYRKGYQLVEFFNNLGFNDVYAQGFPSRWVYTDDKLRKINGTPEIDKCIKNVFAVPNFIGRIDILDSLIADLNQYIAFDKWAVVRNNDVITFKKLDKVVVETPKSENMEDKEDEFLRKAFDTDINSLGLYAEISDIIKSRLKEAEDCVGKKVFLASIIMIGSILEGVLLDTASKYPKEYNQAKSAPRDSNTGNVKKFHEWTLNNYIDVSFEMGVIKQDVKKFSHVVRDFRNYIHPYEQMSSRFFPDEHTALICLQVLKAAISQIGEYHKTNRGGNS